MKELLERINEWEGAAKPFAIATVIKTWGSSPRAVGSTMIISEEGEMAGSVSGGCVEGAVLKSAIDVIQNGGGKTLHYGVTNNDAWAVGLSCGGQLSVFIERFMAFDSRAEEKEVWHELKDCLENNRSCVLISQLVNGIGGHTLILPDGNTVGQNTTLELKEAALNAYQKRQSEVFEDGGKSYFLHAFPRRSQMLIIGAAHITTDLVEFAHSFDFETIVIDPRGAFASKTHFQVEPDLIIEKYPSEVIPNYTLDVNTYAVVLSHNPKIDDNALHLLLRSEIAYIGALGSKKTHAKRVTRLLDAGFSREEVDRIHSPIGVDIKAKGAREIALSIIGEVIGVRNGVRNGE